MTDERETETTTEAQTAAPTAAPAEKPEPMRLKLVRVGERVGALQSARDGVVKFLGFGVRAEDTVPSEDAGGFMADLYREEAVPVPCLHLDSGEVVFGCECWWGSEAEFQQRLARYDRVEHVTVADMRRGRQGMS